MTCGVEILIAARKRGDGHFLTKMTSALERASSTEVTVTVTPWFDAVKAGTQTEHLDVCGLVIIADRMARSYSEDVLADIFQQLLPKLIGRNAPTGKESVIFIHERERVLIRSLCEAFSLDEKMMMKGAEDEEISYYSLASDFYRSRYMRARHKLFDRMTQQPDEAAALADDDVQEDSSATLAKTLWLAMVVEPDVDTAEDMRTFLVNKARRQDIVLRVELRHTVEEAILGMSALLPFAISIRPHMSANWDGLKIVAAAKKLDIPVIVRSHYEPRQIQGALNQHRIDAKPKKLVHVDQPQPWAEAMLSCLMSQTRH